MFAALVGCDKPDSQSSGQGGDSEKPTQEKVSITPNSHEFKASTELTCSVKVESSADWTLTPESASWLTPSITKGKNGATVTFAAKPNTTTDRRGPVTFTFKVGKATATFRAEQAAKDNTEPKPEPKDVLEFKDPSHANLVVGKEGVLFQNYALNTTLTLDKLMVDVEYINDKGWIEAKDRFMSPNLVLTVNPNNGAERKARVIIKTKTPGLVNDLVMNITQEGASVPSVQFELKDPSQSTLEFTSEQGANMVYFRTSLKPEHIRYKTDANWINQIVLAQAGEYVGAGIVVGANNGADRSSTITFSADGASDIVVTINQKGTATQPTDKYLDFKQPNFNNRTIPASGAEELIELNTNIEDAKLQVTAEYTDGDGWIQFLAGSAISQSLFGMTIEPNNGPQRKARVVVRATDGSASDLVMNITQEGTAVSPEPSSKIKVVNLYEAQLYSDWPNAAPLTNMSKFTVEFLATAQTYNKGQGDYALTSFLGIEGKFLIRAASGALEVVTQVQREEKVEVPGILEPNKWYHIAVTFDNGTVTVYVNGQQKVSKMVTMDKVTFATGTWTQETNWGSKRHFYLGHSVDHRRCLNGEMSEVRIWNKVLTASEITAENHYYSVDPNSDGLVAYWKLNEGSGAEAKDSSKNGNHLKGHNKLTANNGGANIGGNVIQWKEVDSNKVN